MNYLEWAQEYRENASRVQAVIEKKKARLNDRNLTADMRKQISDAIISYRVIYRELLKTAELLSSRAQEHSDAA